MIRKHKPFEMPSSVSSTDDNSSALRSESVSHSSSPLARSMSQSQSFHSQIVGGGTSVTCSTEACTFQVGDEVDGLWILANGSQRWFPGQIEMIKDIELIESNMIQTVYEYNKQNREEQKVTAREVVLEHRSGQLDPTAAKHGRARTKKSRQLILGKK